MYSNSAPNGEVTSILKVSSALQSTSYEGSGGKSTKFIYTVAWSQTDWFGAGKQILYSKLTSPVKLSVGW